MKKSILLIVAIVVAIAGVAQTGGGRVFNPEPGGLGSGSNGNSGSMGGTGTTGSGTSGQPGTVTNPVPDYHVDALFVRHYLKVGMNSLYLGNAPTGTTPGTAEVIYSTGNPLVINGYLSGQFNQGDIQNTIINPQVVGRVGIGTMTPNAKLELNVGNNYKTRDAGFQVTVPQQSYTGDDAIDNANTPLIHVRKDIGINNNAIYSTLLTLRDNGFVGIGVDNPDTKLHVHGGIVKITGNNTAGGPMIVFGGNTSVAPYGQWGIEYIDQQGLNFWKPWNSTDGNGSQGFGNYFLYLSDNGQVGMGVDPTEFTDFAVSGYRLHVRNGIIAEKVRVELIANWADYVFAPEYRLMPLQEVDSYIKENGHLPNVPSACEMAETGIDVATMDAKLMEKIEELTLYIIEQEKRIAQLETQIKE